jgi:hypothetical protein
MSVEDDKPKRQQRNEERKPEYSRAENVRRTLNEGQRDRQQGQDRPRPPRRTEQAPPPKSVVNLFGADPLNLFEKASTLPDPLKTWSMLEQREHKLTVTHPPTNHFGEFLIALNLNFVS